MFLYEILVMSVKQEVVCVHDDTHPVACNKIQKKVDSKTVENYVLNETVSVSCARMQVRPVGCGNKEVAQNKCAIRWKPIICGKREGSLSSLDSNNFEKRIKEVNIVGLENKVLLVKVMKNGNESGSTLGKHLPKLRRKQCSLAPLRHNLDKFTSSSTITKDRNTDVLKLEKIELDCALGRIHSPVCCASVVVENNPIQLEGHDEIGHELSSIQKKAPSVSSEICKDSLQHISKCSSKASLYATSLSNTVTELEKINACKIVKNNGNGEGSSKAKNAFAFPISRGSLISGNVGHNGSEKIAHIPSQKIFKLSQQQLENTSTHVELVEKTVNETYKVKCLKNGRCSIKKMEERPKPFKSFGKDIVPVVHRIDDNIQNDLHMLSETGSNHFKGFSLSSSDVNNVHDDGLVSDLCHHRNTDNSFSGKDSDLFQDHALSSSDVNDVHVDSLLSDLCHYEYKDDPFPNVNAECFFDPSETEEFKFQTSVSNATKRWVQQNQCRSSMDSSDEFSFFYSSPSHSMPDVKDLHRKSIEKYPDSAEWISNPCDQFKPVRQKTTVVMPEGFPPHSVPNTSQAVSLDQCNFIDKSSLQSLEDLNLQHIPEPVKENINGMFTDDNLSQVVGTSEGFCLSYDNRTISKDDNAPSPWVSSNLCSETANLKIAVTVQDQKNEEKPMLRNSRILSPKDSYDEIGASHIPTSDVVWTLQTPKPSVAPLSASVPENRESYVNQLPHTDKEKRKYCNLLDVGSSESYPLPVYDEIAKFLENETKDVVDMFETISEAIDAGYSNESNLVAQGCTVDELNVPTSLFEMKEEVKTPKESTETCQKNLFGMEENEMDRCLNPELLNNLDNPNTSEMLAITLPLSGNNPSKNFEEADISPVNDLSDIDSVFGDIPSLPDISSMLTYTGFGYEVADDTHNHQPTQLNLQTISSDVNTTFTNEIWNSLEEVPVDHSLEEKPFNLDVNNPNDFNKLLDSFLLEVDQGFVDSDTHKEVCSYPKNEGNHSSSNITSHNSVLTSMKTKGKFEEMVLLKDLGDGSLPPAVHENHPIEVPQTHSVGHAKKKGISHKTVQSLPVTTSSNTQKEFSDDQTKNEVCGRVARTVSFKTRPATRPIKCVVRGQVVENELQKQPRPLRFVLGKDRRLQNQDGSTSWPQREEFNPEQFTVSRGRNTSCLRNGEQMEDSIPKYSTVNFNPNVIPAVSVSIGNVATTITQMKVPGGVLEATKFVLPVGKTGLSITIPTNAPTNITSFFPPPHPVSCVPPATNPAPIFPSVKHSSSANQVVNGTTSVKSKTPTLLTDLPQQRKSVFQSEDARRIIIPSTVITVGGKAEAVYQVSIPQSSPAESLYMMVPSSTSAQSNSGSGTPSLLPNILPQHTSGQLSSNNAVMSNQVSHCTRQQVITKHCMKSYVHPIAPKVPQLKSTTSLPAKIPLVLNAETSEPIKILINTKSNNMNTLSSTYSQEKGSIEGVTSNEFGIKSEFVQSLRKKILKKKPYPDFIQKKFNRLLTDELRVHFPDMPESILKVLNLPPQAVRRGYFSVRDLKTLRTQALALRLGIIFREHVCVCTAHNCSTCFEFLQQQEALSLAESKRKVSSKPHFKSGTSGGRGRSKGRGRRRKNVRVSYEENTSDSNCKPPQSFISTSKRKVDDVYHISHLNRTSKIARAGDLTENSIKFSGMLEAGNENKVMDKDFCSMVKMKRSYSDSDIHTHTEVPPLKDDRPLSCDDSYLMIYHTIKDSHCSLNMKWSITPEVGKESSENKGILTKDQLRNRPKKKWESRQHANMMMVAVNDLHLRKQLEKDFVPFTEEGTQQNKKLSTASVPKPLYFDLHSLEIGPLNLAKFEQHFQPKLHVIYTARKFVYEFEIRQNGEEGEDQKPAVEELQYDSPLHLFLTIDVPFSTLQAINVTSNLVLLVMNTIPVAQVMGKRGISCITLSEEDVLSRAQLNYLSHLKAALTIYPLHKVLVCSRGRALSLRDGLCGFSDWFTQMMSKIIPLQDDQIPSWSLASHVDASMIVSEISRTVHPGSDDNLSSTQNHPAHLRKLDQETWQEQAKNSAVMEGFDSIMNSASGPSSAALYLISAVKAALESKGVLHPVPFSPAVQFPLAPYLEKGCSCEGTCHIMECPCARAGALCRTRQTCLCKECDNPLNILHVLGLDVHTARVDECLMQNLYSYNMAGLCSLLVSQVILPCCGAAPELLHIIPGTVVCNSCGMAVCYSWCSHHIHLQNLCPRNHCLICCSCKPALHTHCQKCHQCTPSTSQGLCANCGTHKLF